MFDSFRGYLQGIYKGKRPRKGIRIFSYHGIVESKKDPKLERNFRTVSDFRAQLKFLKKFTLLSLPELYEMSKNGQIPDKAAVITFDDGYENNLLAFEMLTEMRIPGAVFISTGSIGKDKTIWTEELALLLLFGERTKLEILEKSWGLDNRLSRENAYQEIRTQLKRKSAEEKNECMETLRKQFPKEEAKRLLGQFPSMKMLSWKEVKSLSSQGIEVGSHGAAHEIHHGHQSKEVRMSELICSKKEIEKETGKICEFFAYPNGNFVPESPDELKVAGYKFGFTTVQDTFKETANPFLIPRLEPPGRTHQFANQFYWA